MLTEAARHDLYESLQISNPAIREIEEIRLASPARKTGKSALCNQVVHLFDSATSKHVVTESRSVEALFVMNAKVGGTVLEVHPQPPIKGVTRFSPNGQRTVASMTGDFLVYRPNGISIVECKPSEELQKLCRSNPREWKVVDGEIRRPALDGWATARGMTYELWSPPEPHGCLWANLELVFPYVKAVSAILTADERGVLAAVSKAPLTLADMLAIRPGALPTVLSLLAAGRLFANLKSGLFCEPNSMWLSCDEARVSELDRIRLSDIATRTANVVVGKALLKASATDVGKARSRLERVDRIIRGEEPPTARLAPLVQRVKAARRDGSSALEMCLTSYATSGNRGSRLTNSQEKLIALHIKEKWRTGVAKSMDDLYTGLKGLCEQATVDCPSMKALRRRARELPRAPRDIAIGGNRQFHHYRTVTDPLFRSVRAVLPFSMMHIDATKFDHASKPDYIDDLPFACPTLYSAIDSCTGDILGRSLTFGPPSRYGLGLLLRDIVARHGKLPRWWVADRGSELWSRMIIAFAEAYGINLIMRPAGAGRFGSEIENALKQINQKIAHRLVGSTYPDQKGRAVDGKFKSRRTACMLFKDVVSIVDDYLFDLWRDVPIGVIGDTPRAMQLELGYLSEEQGVRVDLDDSFRIYTAVPCSKFTVQENGTVWGNYRPYTSKPLVDALKHGAVLRDLRLDCADLSIGYAQFGADWIKCFTSDVLTHQIRDDSDRLYDLLSTSGRAKRNRQAKAETKVVLSDRLDLALASRASTHAVRPERTTPSANTVGDAHTESSWSVDPDDIATMAAFGGAT